MTSVRVTFVNRNRQFKAPNELKRLLRECCRRAALVCEPDRLFEVTLYFTDDEYIRQINAEYRNIDKSTDVLSFPMGENGEYDENPESGRLMLGDILISAPHAYAQAEEYGHSPEREFAYLTVHGMLHLMGYDHMQDRERAIMRQKEELILKTVGLERS